MKKILDRLQTGGERTKLLVSIGAVVLVVLAAMLLPLAFRAAPDGEEPAAALTLEERTRMFADYWTEGAEAAGFAVTKPDPVPRQMRERCETVMQTLIARSIDDQGLEDLSPTGSEYTVVTDSAGREIKVCRMWLEKRGDWQNWMDVCFDADTGELYYYYLSRECLTNRKLYERADIDAEGIAASLAEDHGWTLRYLAEEADGGAAAVYSSAGGTLCYAISCRVYDALIDIKVSCR